MPSGPAAASITPLFAPSEGAGSGMSFLPDASRAKSASGLASAVATTLPADVSITSPKPPASWRSGIVRGPVNLCVADPIEYRIGDLKQHLGSNPRQVTSTWPRRSTPTPSKPTSEPAPLIHRGRPNTFPGGAMLTRTRVLCGGPTPTHATAAVPSPPPSPTRRADALQPPRGQPIAYREPRSVPPLRMAGRAGAIRARLQPMPFDAEGRPTFTARSHQPGHDIFRMNGPGGGELIVPAHERGSGGSLDRFRTSGDVVDRQPPAGRQPRTTTPRPAGDHIEPTHASTGLPSRQPA